MLALILLPKAARLLAPAPVLLRLGVGEAELTSLSDYAAAPAAADGSAIGVAKMVQLEDIGADERKHAGRIAERVTFSPFPSSSESEKLPI